MRQGIGSINKWNLSCYSHRVLAVLVGFHWSVCGEGPRRRRLWDFIPLPTRAGRRWPMVWQGRQLGLVAETGRFATMEALSTIFLLLCLAFYFSYFLLHYPGTFIFLVFFRLCSSHLLLSASSTYFHSTCYFFLCHLYLASPRNYLLLFVCVFFWFLFLG